MTVSDDDVLAALGDGPIPPTQEELAMSLKTSRATIQRRLQSLIRKGLVRHDPNKRRSVVPTRVEGRGKGGQP